MIILDTNVVSGLMRLPPDQVVVDWLDRQPRTSVWTTSITILEIRFGLARLAEGRRRTQMTEAFEALVAESLAGRLLSFDQADAERTAILSAERAAIGRPIELRDSMIAGIALARRAALATRNIRHFADTGIPLLDPWAPDKALKSP